MLLLRKIEFGNKKHASNNLRTIIYYLSVYDHHEERNFKVFKNEEKYGRNFMKYEYIRKNSKLLVILNLALEKSNSKSTTSELFYAYRSLPILSF